MPSYDTSVVATKLEMDVSVEADAAALKMEGNEHQGVRASCGPWQNHCSKLCALTYWAQLSLIAVSA